MNRMRVVSATPKHMPVAMAAQRFAKDETIVAPGELTVRVDISGLYELAR